MASRLAQRSLYLYALSNRHQRRAKFLILPAFTSPGGSLSGKAALHAARRALEWISVAKHMWRLCRHKSTRARWEVG